ncbi:LrgB family protein [Aerococcaceae bacterium DSM 111020]|nr:LrgB family protein [Aerococcaceae bacterium DSM 111020]
MNIVLNSPIIWLVLTIGIYLMIAKIQANIKSTTLKPFVNPLLLSIIVIIIILILFDIPYEMYSNGGQYLSLFVTPATVALAIKLEKSFIYLKRYMQPVIIGIVSGAILHTILIIIFGVIFKFDYEMIATLYPKSITTAIAVDVSQSMGGLVSLTVAIVVVTGVVGNVIGESLLKSLNVTDPVAQGIAIGTSAHAVGTSKAIQMGELQGAMSSLAIVVTGIVMVLLAPVMSIILNWMF